MGVAMSSSPICPRHPRGPERMTHGTLVERVAVRTGAVSTLRATRRHGFRLAASRCAHHPRTRQQLLQIGTLARRTGRLAARRHERFEVPSAPTAGVFEQGHFESLSYQLAAGAAARQFPTSNSQRPINSQLPTPNFRVEGDLGSWALGVDWALGVGSWELTRSPVPYAVSLTSPMHRASLLMLSSTVDGSTLVKQSRSSESPAGSG